MERIRRTERFGTKELKEAKELLKMANAAELATQGTDAHEQASADAAYHAKHVAEIKSKLDGITVLNDGNPMEIGATEGCFFTLSPSTAKKHRAYYTDKPVPLTKWEKKMPGVVVGQNRGMLFSSKRNIKGEYIIPENDEMNLIVVDEKSEKIIPIDTDDVKIAWVGNGEHFVKEVGYDGGGQQWFLTKDGKLATDLYFKTGVGYYGLKGVVGPGLATDVGCEVVDHWGIVRRITIGNTLLINSSMIKGLNAYSSLEELKAHAKEWGLDKLMAQWQSGDHMPTGRRPMGTQPNATNIELTFDEITEMLKPEALRIWANKFESIAWMQQANINTTRGRAFAARPGLIENELVMTSIDQQSGNKARKLAQGKFMAKGAYLKLFPDKLAYSLMYIHGMSRNEAAKKAAATGLHGEVRVNPSFAGRYYFIDENGEKQVAYKEETFRDAKGRYIEAALVRYPHGAPSETIIQKLYLDDTVPADVIIMPLPVANDDMTIPAKDLLCLRLQGADFDGDAVTAYIEKIWLEAQRRNEGKPYMVIPVNTESTEKDKTPVTDENFELFCQMKADSLSNQVGLIATHLKYLVSQMATSLRLNDEDAKIVIKSIVDAAIAMGNDIDEFKHGKATLEMALYQLEMWDNEVIYLKSPYFNRYAMKYKSEEDFNKAVFNKNGSEKLPGTGTLDMFAVAAEKLMAKAGIPFVPEKAKASDGKDRWYYTVHPVGWKAKNPDLFIGKGEGHTYAALPAELESVYGLEHGTLLSAKDLLMTLYRNHSADLKDLDFGADKDTMIKQLSKIDAKYTLAKVAIVAWTKAMKKAKDGVDLTAEEAMKVFATLIVQHTKNARSPLEVLTETGVCKRNDGTVYEKTVFSAQSKLNFFLDTCGDGLLFAGTEKPDFPQVSENVIDAVQAKMPDLDKAMEIARKEMKRIDDLVSRLSDGIAVIEEEIEEFSGFYVSDDTLPDEIPDFPDDIPEEF